MKVVGKYIAVFLCLIAAYVLFGIVSNLLPNKPIIKNVAKTLERGDLPSETDCYAIIYKTETKLDHFTDAIILNQACNGGRDSLMASVLLVPRYVSCGYECANLRSFISGEENMTKSYYDRYWHGSTFLMRWLLMVTNYISIRLLFYILSSFLLLWVCVALYRRLGALVMCCYMMSLLLVNVFVMQFSIQYLPVLIIALGSTLWVLYKVKKPSQMMMTLFVAGSLTAYFDLLTCPVMTWGLPLCVYVMLCEEDTFKRRLLSIGTSSVLWAVGYAFTWISKWVIASLFTSQNVMKESVEQIMIRAGSTPESVEIARWAALMKNMGLIAWGLVAIVLVVLTIIAITHFRRKGLQTALLSLFLAVPPLLWYLFAANHSYIHSWFTYRSMSVVLLAIFLAEASLVERKGFRWRKV